jgi:hypothetical protein
MKTSLSSFNQVKSRAVAHQSSNGISRPAVVAQQIRPVEASQTKDLSPNIDPELETILPDAMPEQSPVRNDLPSGTDAEQDSVSASTALEYPVRLDMDDDGEDEPHILFINPEDGMLWLHSDKQTLARFLEKKGDKQPPGHVMNILVKIKNESKIIHDGRYGARGSDGKRRAPTSKARDLANDALVRIAGLLVLLNQTMSSLMKKQRPPSHQDQLVLRQINGDDFCEKVVVAPLSILHRDDGEVGSSPSERTKLWRDLTKIAGYKRGHMLNEHLHGPGKNWNLVPISTAFNSTMREGVEKKTKEVVNTDNKVVRFEAEALDWGQFKGAFGFQEEKKLPARFHFKVTQMKLITGQGYDGSKVAHWYDTGTILFEDTPAHDIPTDVVKGVTAPVSKTFRPGLYFHPGGSITEHQPGSNKYLLKGNFGVNNLTYLLDALGLDDSPNLPTNYISESVLTKYKVPPGYHIVYPFPATQLEYITPSGKVIPVQSVEPAFLIINSANHNTLLAEFEEKKRKLREDEENIKKKEALWQTQDRQRREQNQEDERLKEEKLQQEKDAQKRNELYRRKLLADIRFEMERYEDEFSDRALEKFLSKREDILYYDNKKWKQDKFLFDKGEDELLSPVREKMIAMKEETLVWEQNEEAKDEFIDGLMEYLVGQVRTTFLPGLTKKAADYFKREVAGIFDRRIKQWRYQDDLVQHPPEKYMEEAMERLRKLFDAASERYKEQEQSERKEEYPGKQSSNLKRKRGKEKDKDIVDVENERRDIIFHTRNVKPDPRSGEKPSSSTITNMTLEESKTPNMSMAGEVLDIIFQLLDAHKNTFLEEGFSELIMSIKMYMNQPDLEGWQKVSGLLSGLLEIDTIGNIIAECIEAWNEAK